jgi:diguanylate cyclase (GGDEF)-like protein
MSNSNAHDRFLLQSDPIDILIVDDVLDNIRLLSKILEQHGYITRKATNGTMALKAAEIAPPSLILLDIRMPGINGYEVCQKIKSHPKTAHIPVIFLSAADEVVDIVQAFQAGGADYVTKPFHIEEVLARVQHQLTIIAAQQTIYRLNAQLEERVKERTQQLEIANAQLLKMAFHDSLTQLPNRSALMKQLRAAIQQQQVGSTDQFAVLYLDCDRFKIVNDSLGHLAGDELLIAIAQRLQSTLQPDDFLARLGGDEFVILLTNLTEQETTHVAQRILMAFAAPFHLKERDIFVSFSIGIVLNCSTYQRAEDLLRDADIAMYQAKSLGKDQYQIFAPAMQQTAYQRLQLEMDLRKAIQQQELQLYYQPIVELATGKVVGAEALLRWHHPIYHAISPSEFIPIAEETGLILKLGHQVLKEACHQLRRWQEQRVVDSSFALSINVSAYQFAQPNLVQQIDEILLETGLSSKCLKLEITETAIIQNVSSAADIICSLRERCVQLSFDDFGTGYSSLSYLHSFPVDNLKIDRSFVQRLPESSSSLGLVRAIVQIAKTMNMNLIAEGIETREQFDQLHSLGCQFGQGYLFSKPLSSEDIAEFLLAYQGTFRNL